MNQIPEQPPAGWYADPQTGQGLRYWDGNAWTEHTAPLPTAQAVAHAPELVQPPEPIQAGVAATAQPAAYGVSAGQHQYQQQWTPPPHVPMNRRTLLVLLVCIALAITSVVGAVFARNVALNANRVQAQEALDGFLDAATTGDDVWRDFANDSLLRRVPVGSPVRGEDQTAKALDLEVTYEASPLEYSANIVSPSAAKADAAVSEVIFTYTFTFDEKQYTSTAQQEVWLTRPFYFGDDVPQRSYQGAKKATAVGPWRVTSIVEPALAVTAQNSTDFFSTDFEVVYGGPTDDNTCYSGAEVLREISSFARIDGEMLSSCRYGKEGTTYIGDNVDMDELAQNFPIFGDDYKEILPVPELTQIESSGHSQSQPPFQQYYLSTAAGNYVLTVAAVGLTESPEGKAYGATRVVSIQKIEGTE